MEYDHETYWPEMLEKCREQRNQHLSQWRALGDAKAGHEESLWRKIPLKDGKPDLDGPDSQVQKDSLIAEGVARDSVENA